LGAWAVGGEETEVKEGKDHWGYDKENKPDIVEVVRCRNCVYGHYDRILCLYWCGGVPHSADFFCAMGKRISNDTVDLTAQLSAEMQNFHR